ncbi:hypothetical protein EPA93_07205 [Ktedonosporobacter rubrisoli]|uniref:Uncharacterized protein n=1 Tax=Ktedonosporobacter rubrisoli TaxID=2509675 RepID=A0A4P6JKW5_KTERU|nr:hypothetical protein [Ktedonosporobacter rubrisoli]QBD75805.1 hypothetical protein EPA93_07205 [Ktedonosporobacter rubrisoli]
MIALDDLQNWVQEELQQARQAGERYETHCKPYLATLAAIKGAGDANDVLAALTLWARERRELENVAVTKICQKIHSSLTWSIWRRKRNTYVAVGEEGIFLSLYEAWNRTYELWEQTGGHYLVAICGGRFERELLMASEIGGRL